MSELQAIKKEFMAMRNGILADQLRVALNPSPYTVVFGLMVPQLAQISRMDICREVDPNALWSDRHVRESRLLACYLFDPAAIGFEQACDLIEDLQTKEEADMLAFRLLQRLPFAQQLVEKYAAAESPLLKYAASTLRNKL